jgi:HPt (histidine-containing phosphotransfer) domain-containing protein
MSNSPIDEEALLDLVDGDRHFLASLVETFRTDCASYLDAIREAVEAGDAEALCRQAHGLKGAAANMQAEAVQRAAQQLEELGRAEDLEQASEALDQLEGAVDRIMPVLKALAEDTS